MFVHPTPPSFIRPCVPSETMFVHQTPVPSSDPWTLAPVLQAPITLLHCNFCNLCHYPDKSGYLHLLCIVWLAILLLAVGKITAPSILCEVTGDKPAGATTDVKYKVVVFPVTSYVIISATPQAFSLVCAHH